MDDRRHEALGDSSSVSRTRERIPPVPDQGQSVSGHSCEIPGVDEEVTCPQLDERGAVDLTDWQMLLASQGLRARKGVLRHRGGGTEGGTEVVGERLHLATGSLGDSQIAGDDMVDEGLHIPFGARSSQRQLVGRDIE
jgi:hypothetical protein